MGSLPEVFVGAKPPIFPCVAANRWRDLRLSAPGLRERIGATKVEKYTPRRQLPNPSLPLIPFLSLWKPPLWLQSPPLERRVSWYALDVWGCTDAPQTIIRDLYCPVDALTRALSFQWRELHTSQAMWLYLFSHLSQQIPSSRVSFVLTAIIKLLV